MAYTVEQLTGLVNATIAQYGRKKVTDIASDIQEYVVMDKLMKENKISYAGGDNYQFNVTKTLGSNARHTALFETDDVNVTDSIVQGTVKWCFTDTSYAFDTREKAINSGDEVQIVDHIRLRRDREMAGLTELCEQDFWANNAVDSTTDKTPYGLPYWVCKVASGYTTITDHDFVGGDPSGFTGGAAGLPVATYPNYQNYAGNYSTVEKDDLIKAMRRAHRLTKFKSPIKHPNYDSSGLSEKYQIYVNLDTIQEMEEVGEAQNDNLGRDLASMDGSITFRKNPIMWIPYLDSDATDPVYMINWGVFHMACLKDWVLKETTKPAPQQHNVVETFVDLGWNTACEDRRKQAVLSKEAS